MVSGVFAFGGFDDFDVGCVRFEFGGDVSCGVLAGAVVVAILDDGDVHACKGLAVFGSPFRLLPGLPRSICPGGGHDSRSFERQDILFAFD